MAKGDPKLISIQRLGLADLEFTANKLLKGAGAGSNPTEIAVPSPKSIATGSYTGDDTDGRQITTGFIPSLVVIQSTFSDRRVIMVPSMTLSDNASSDNLDVVSDCYIHASDGFVVETTNTAMNHSSGTYYYWAISE